MYHIVSVLKTQALKPVCPPLYNILNTITKQFWLELLFPVPVITHLKLQYTSWLLQNLSKLFLKLLTELELTTCTGKLFMVWIVHGMKSSNSPGTQSQCGETSRWPLVTGRVLSCPNRKTATGSLCIYSDNISSLTTAEKSHLSYSHKPTIWQNHNKTHIKCTID